MYIQMFRVANEWTRTRGKLNAAQGNGNSHRTFGTVKRKKAMNANEPRIQISVQGN